MSAEPKLRLLIYGVNYAPWSTGIPRYTGELGSWLAAHGHAVDAIAALPHYPAWRIDPRYRGKGFHVEEIDGVRVHRTPLRMPRTENVRSRDRILLDSTFAVGASRYWSQILFRRARYDVVIAICPSIQSVLHPWLYRLARSVPFVLHVQDLQVDVANRLGMLRNRPLGGLLTRTEALLLRRASRVSTISEAMRSLVVDKGVPHDRTWLVPNWADIEIIRPAARRNAFSAELGLTERDVLVLSAGAMGNKHGLELVLEAAARLRDQPEIRFALVGDGSARPGLEARAAEMGLRNVVFLPLQPPERLPDMLAAGDIHLVIQRREAADLVMPSRLSNIFAAGRPTVATVDPGSQIYQVLQGEGLGRTCPPEDAAGLADTIATLARDPSARQESGRRARQYAERHLDRDRILGEFNTKLVQLAAMHRPQAGVTGSRSAADSARSIC